MQSVPPAETFRRVPMSLQARMVILSYLAYFFYYFTRKHLGVAAGSLVQDGYSESMIAAAQTGYGVCYAVGQLMSGALGDRIGPRIALCAGMVLSGISSIAFGIFPFIGVLVVGMTLNGLFQSTGWSSSCKLLTCWVSDGRRGRIMGVWMTCYILGSLAANATAGWLLYEYGWRQMFLITGITVAIVGVIQGVFLISRPEQRNYAFEKAPGSEEASVSGGPLKEGFSAMIRQPAVILLGISYTGIKFVRYTLFFWLPYYLATAVDLPGNISAYVSNGFEMGGVVGLLIGGLVADRFFRQNRARLALGALVGMVLSLALFRVMSIEGGAWGNLIMLGVIGFFLYIADSIISGSAAQDIGGVGSTASATGIINGIGSISQPLASFVPIWLKARWGWDAVSLTFIIVAVFSCLAILPVALRDKLKRG